MSSPRLADNNDSSLKEYQDLEAPPSPGRFQQASAKAKQIGQQVSNRAKALQRRTSGLFSERSAQLPRMVLLEESSGNESTATEEPAFSKEKSASAVLRKSVELFGKRSHERTSRDGASETTACKPIQLTP